MEGGGKSIEKLCRKDRRWYEHSLITTIPGNSRIMIIRHNNYSVYDSVKIRDVFNTLV